MRPTGMLGTFAGMEIRVSDLATEFVGHSFDPIPYSRHRSKRIWKKLLKRQRLTRREIRNPCMYKLYDRLIVHPAVMKELRDGSYT